MGLAKCPDCGVRIYGMIDDHICKDDTNKQIYAFIKEEKDDALWLIVENGGDGTAHPIFKNEVVAILEACKKYLEKTNV